jgi:hypothetical protein
VVLVTWHGKGKGRNTHEGFGIDEVGSVGMVEICDAFSCEFEVLGLVFSDWDVGCSLCHLISLILITLI